MARLRTWALRVVGALVLIVMLAAGTVYAVSAHQLSRSYADSPLPTPLASTPALVERGRHLAAVGQCMECHGENLAGLPVIDDPAFGHVYSANLTTGKGGVAGSYTDAELIRAFRQGVKHDGSPIAFMPVADFRNFSDEDASAIVAYLRTIPPVDHVQPKSSLGPIGRMLLITGNVPVLVPARKYAAASTHVPSVVPAPTAEYGEYLSRAIGCRGCHGDELRGGKVPGGPPSWPAAPSINAEGLSGWSEADFVKTLRTGVVPGGRVLNAAMPYRLTKLMTDDELHALWLYLSTYHPPAATKG
jgi:cytochrome c553